MTTNTNTQSPTTTTTAPQYIPDAEGTVLVKGFEEDADEFRAWHATLKRVERMQAAAKTKFRTVAATVLAQAAAGAKRVLFLSPEGGISCTAPDVEKSGNRPNLNSKETGSKITKAGGLESLLPALGPGAKLSDLVEDDESVTLSGEWLGWFKRELATFQAQGVPQAGAPGTVPAGVEYSLVRRIKVSALEAVRAAARLTDDSPLARVAKVVLDSGIKEMLVDVKK